MAAIIILTVAMGGISFPRSILAEMPPPVSSVELYADPATPQPSGTTVTFTAVATGGSGSYEYAFWGRPAGSTTWSLLRIYSSSNTCIWNTGGFFLGAYEIRVDVRNVGATTLSEASKLGLFVVTSSAVSGLIN